MNVSKLFHEILGDSVNLVENPSRIVSLWPSITETIVRLGLLEKLSGVSAWCKLFVEDVKKIPAVSSATQVNYRRLEEAKPDLILTSTGVQRPLAMELHSRGYRVFPITLERNICDIIGNIVVIGTLVGKQKAAFKLREELLEELRAFRDIKPSRRPSVYVEIWPYEYSITVGGLTFINDLLYASGVINIFSEKPAAYFTADPREVSSLNPDFMIFIFEGRGKAKVDAIHPLISKREWESVKAVRENRLMVFSELEIPLTHSGPSFVETIKRLSEKFREFGVF